MEKFNSLIIKSLTEKCRRFTEGVVVRCVKAGATWSQNTNTETQDLHLGSCSAAPGSAEAATSQNPSRLIMGLVSGYPVTGGTRYPFVGQQRYPNTNSNSLFAVDPHARGKQ